MREADPLAVELHDPCVESRSETGARAHTRGRLGERDRRMRVRGGGEEEVAALGREREQAGVDELVQRLRHRQRLTRLDRDARASEHPDDLERVERVSAGGAVHLGEKRAGQRDAEVVLDDVMQRTEIERARPSTVVKRPSGKRPSELVDERRSRAPTGATGARRPAPRAAASPRTRGPPKTPRRATGRRPPRRRPAAARPARAAHPSSATPTACGSGGGPSSSSSTSARESARLCPAGSGCQRLVEHGIEQVADAGERERRLALGRHGLEHAEPLRLRLRDAGAPERRLPHAGLALEHERGGGVGDAGDEAVEGGELGSRPETATVIGRSYASARAEEQSAAGRYSRRGLHDLPAVRARVGAARRRRPAHDRRPLRRADPVAREHLALPAGRARQAPRGSRAGGGLRRARRHADGRPRRSARAARGRARRRPRRRDRDDPPAPQRGRRGARALHLRRPARDAGRASSSRTCPRRAAGSPTPARSNTSSPSRASTRTVSPSENRPSSSSRASGFSSSRWIARLSGRAP